MDARRVPLRENGPPHAADTVISRPRGGVIGQPLFHGSGGDVQLACGNCDFTLAVGISQPQRLAALIFLCPRCGCYGRL